MSTLKNIIGDYKQFLTDIIQKIKSEEFDFTDFSQLDVLCYRTDSMDHYQEKKQQLEEVGTMLSEAMVSGRPIATFRLNEPIYFKNWRIDAIELPAPKEGSDKPAGLEHVQFVLFDSLQAFIQKYKDKEFDTRAIDRGVNPMIAYKFKGGAVKFHIISLPAAIYLESKLSVESI